MDQKQRIKLFATGMLVSGVSLLIMIVTILYWIVTGNGVRPDDFVGWEGIFLLTFASIVQGFRLIVYSYQAFKGKDFLGT